MSAYKDVTDFPSRCIEFLEATYPAAEAAGREVSLLLMVAASAFIVPYERLRDPQGRPHPSQDRERNPELADRLDRAVTAQFAGSRFHERGSSWEFGTSLSLDADPDSWNYAKLDSQETRQVLAILRNALAHGNIFTTGNPISALVFASRRNNGEGWQYIRVSPKALRRALKSWIEFLKENKAGLGDGAAAVAAVAAAA